MPGAAGANPTRGKDKGGQRRARESRLSERRGPCGEAWGLHPRCRGIICQRSNSEGSFQLLYYHKTSSQKAHFQQKGKETYFLNLLANQSPGGRSALAVTGCRVNHRLAPMRPPSGLGTASQTSLPLRTPRAAQLRGRGGGKRRHLGIKHVLPSVRCSHGLTALKN